jgi:glycosyltransferase involved in cell wall biosynthesis
MTRIVVIAAGIDRPRETTLVTQLAAELHSRHIAALVLSPPGPVADALRRIGIEHRPIDDLEPLSDTRHAMRAALRRGRRVARHHRAVLDHADHIVLVGPTTLACLADRPTRPAVTLVIDAIAVGASRRVLAVEGGQVDQVFSHDERVTLAFGAVAPPVHLFHDDATAARQIADTITEPSPAHRDAERSVVLAVPDYLPSLGGTTRQARNQATAARAQGRRAVVVTQRIDRRWPRLQRIDGVDVHRVGPASRHRLAMKFFVFRAALWMRRHRDQIDIVNAVMYPDLAVSARLAGINDRIVICWAGLGDATDTLGRNHHGVRRLLAFARRRLLRDVAHVALTPAIVFELEGLGIRDRVHVIPTPIDLHRFRPPTPGERADQRRELGLSDDELAVLYVGHLRELKRVDRLIEAFAMVRAEHPNAHLFLVGGARDDLEDRTEDWRALAHRMELGASVTFTGFTDHVEPYLHACDVFVLPSEREGLSNSILEAMACGLVCVAPPSAGGDQVLDPHTGIVPRTNDALDLAAAISELARDPERRRAMGEAAARSAQRYSVHAVSEAYSRLYDTLASS